jgi:hypothetical protein
MKLEHHVYVHFSTADAGAALARIEATIAALTMKENAVMALGQDILDRIAAEKTTIDSVVALITEFRNANIIPADVATAILAKLDENKGELDTALQPAP